jgi:hypothetical protein
MVYGEGDTAEAVLYRHHRTVHPKVNVTCVNLRHRKYSGVMRVVVIIGGKR